MPIRSRLPEVFRRCLGKLVDEITNDDGLERAAQQEAAATVSVKVDDDSGMHVLFAKLTPEQGNRIRRALDRLVCGTATRGMAPAEVAVLIDYQTLTTGRRDSTVCKYSDGTSVPVEKARRHACDANIIPVVLGGDSRPLVVGRARRLATATQRTALRAMYRTCAIDGCDRHFDACQVHHLVEWDDDGLTDLDNLVPVCSFHHHRVHEGRWRLQLDPSTRQLTVTLPDSTIRSESIPDHLTKRNAT